MNGNTYRPKIDRKSWKEPFPSYLLLPSELERKNLSEKGCSFKSMFEGRGVDFVSTSMCVFQQNENHLKIYLNKS